MELHSGGVGIFQDAHSLLEVVLQPARLGQIGAGAACTRGEVVEELVERLRAIRAELGTTLLVVEQNAQVALDLADYGYVMENGRIVLEGAAADLKANEDVREFYLGLNLEGERKSYREVKQYRRRKRWLG